jgi:hypothetical protein
MSKPAIAYIGGPMSGIPDKNRAMFDRVAAELRAREYFVINPGELGESADWPWEACVSRDISMMMAQEYLTAIVLLPGWRASGGARIELFCAVCVKGATAYEWTEANALRPLCVTREKLLNLIAHPAEV